MTLEILIKSKNRCAVEISKTVSFLVNGDSKRLLLFIRFLPGKDKRFHHMLLQFKRRSRSKLQPFAIQRRIDNLGERYYEDLITRARRIQDFWTRLALIITAVEYLDSLSFVAATT